MPRRSSRTRSDSSACPNNRNRISKSYRESRRSIVALEDTLVRLGSPFHDPEVDWQSRARAAADRERTASQRSIASPKGSLTEKPRCPKDGESPKTRVDRRRRFPCQSAGCLGDPPVPSEQPAADDGRRRAWSRAGGFDPGTPVSSWKSRRSIRPVEKEIQELTSERAKYKESEVEAYRDIRQAMSASALGSVDEFLNAAKESEGLRQQIAGLNFRGRGLEIELAKSSAELAQIYSRLEASMARVGVRCSPDDLTSQLEEVRQNLRQYRECSTQYQTSLHTVNSLAKGRGPAGRRNEPHGFGYSRASRNRRR